MIILSLNMIKHIIKNNSKLNNTQLAYIQHELKSSHTIKVLSTTSASTFPHHINK